MTTTIEERVTRLERLAALRVKEASYAGTRVRESIAIVIREVAIEFGTTTSRILKKDRCRESVWPRQVAMYIARRLNLTGTQVIGEAFAGRDHGTVIYASRAVQAIMDTEKGTKLMVERLTQEIRIKIANEHAK